MGGREETNSKIHLCRTWTCSNGNRRKCDNNQHTELASHPPPFPTVKKKMSILLQMVRGPDKYKKDTELKIGRAPNLRSASRVARSAMFIESSIIAKTPSVLTSRGILPCSAPAGKGWDGTQIQTNSECDSTVGPLPGPVSECVHKTKRTSHIDSSNNWGLTALLAPADMRIKVEQFPLPNWLPPFRITNIKTERKLCFCNSCEVYGLIAGSTNLPSNTKSDFGISRQFGSIVKVSNALDQQVWNCLTYLVNLNSYLLCESLRQCSLILIRRVVVDTFKAYYTVLVLNVFNALPLGHDRSIKEILGGPIKNQFHQTPFLPVVLCTW